MYNKNLLQELLIQTSKMYPDKYAICIGKNKITYQQLLSYILTFADTLKKNGYQRGDRVVICAKNSIYVVVAFWAAIISDGIVSIISPELSDEKILYILKDSTASVFVSDKLSNKIINNLVNYPNLTQIYITQEIEYSDSLSNISYFKLQNFENHTQKMQFKNNELDLASIIYTSGTTGEPKGVMMTHRNMLAAALSINQYLGYSAFDTILSVLPLSFDYGLYQMILAFSAGSTLILETDALFPAHILHKIESEQISILPGVPTLFSLLAEHGKRFKYDYSSLRMVTNTGATLTYKNINEITEMFYKAKIFSMYGLTECKRCTYLPPDDIQKKPNSVGIAIPNTELWIVDDIGQKVKPGVVGQLVIRGATIMRGYWNKQEETNKKLKNGSIFGEKILYTGDLAMLDDDGYLYFKGRMDEIIKFKGFKISPTEIETNLGQLPDINEIVLINIMDNDNESKLVICLSVSSNANHDMTKSRIRSALPNNLKNIDIIIIKNLPKNINGKIDKLNLIAQIKDKLCF